MGATRAAVDAGWIRLRPPDRPDRQDGCAPSSTSPAVFPAPPSTWSGMQSADFIVAINKDPQAPIFQVADVGLVGDLFEIIPALIQEIKKDRG